MHKLVTVHFFVNAVTITGAHVINAFKNHRIRWFFGGVRKRGELVPKVSHANKTPKKKKKKRNLSHERDTVEYEVYEELKKMNMLL